MQRSYVEKHRHVFVVKTAKITPWGFTNIRKTGQFDTLEEANAKAKLCNYIWQKCKELSVALCLVLIMSSSAFAMQASWYSVESLKREGTYKYSKGVMANGHLFSDDAYTCANNLYPLGTVLRITNLNSGRQVIVKTTDRIGKRFGKTRIDLSKAAFADLSGEQGTKVGLLPIKVEVVK